MHVVSQTYYDLRVFNHGCEEVFVRPIEASLAAPLASSFSLVSILVCSGDYIQVLGTSSESGCWRVIHPFCMWFYQKCCGGSLGVLVFPKPAA